jgi:saccharopine dehydrogenase-like NADP-dependent oxidoreductase
LKENGVVPPEKIGMDEKLFQLLLEGLEDRGVTIVKEETD